MDITFAACDYTPEERFTEAAYAFSGSAGGGWTIARNGAEILRLGPGYRALRTLLCGICSTDLARRHLPFPLPQVIGHEAAARDPETGEIFVPEINDTCTARRDPAPCPFCRSGLPTHCPDRMVLGIDRLPGSFGAWILIPEGAAVPAGDLPPRTAVLAEPLAAALHAAAVSPPRAGARIAVLGAGRLGLLIIAALSSLRANAGIDCSITALDPREKNREIALSMGGDRASPPPARAERRRGMFDTVFEASGSPGGLETALAIAGDEIHLKSTHGRECSGMRHLTGMVVDEISLLPDRADSFEFTWAGEHRAVESVYIAPAASVPDLPAAKRIFRGEISEAVSMLTFARGEAPLPRFDIAVASSSEEIDGCLRPREGSESSLVRPRGGVVFRGVPAGNPLLDFIASGGTVRTSRCGDIRQAVELLQADGGLRTRIGGLITHEFPASRIPEAFRMAASPDAIKVIITHE